jgi:site-specific recombinase XerD
MLLSLWERFVEVRKNLKGVSPKTLEAYGHAWRAWGGSLPEDEAQLDEDVIENLTITLRQREGLCAISVNTYLKVLKTFLRWLAAKRYIPRMLPVQFVITPKLVPTTYTRAQLRAILALRPTRMSEARAHLIAMLYLDTGARAREILKLRREDVQLETCLLNVVGKGNKQRLVPFSRELRADLVGWMRPKVKNLPQLRGQSQ